MRPLPHNKDIESGLIGACLVGEQERTGFIDKVIDYGVKPDWFHETPNRLVFETIINMSVAGETVDLLTVGERLKSVGAIEQVGGFEVLNEMVDKSFSWNWQSHAETLEKDYKKRKIIIAAQAGIDSCYQDADPDEVIAAVSGDLTEIGHKKQTRTTSEIMADNITVLNNAVLGISSGIPLPWETFSRNTGGIQRASVVPLVGRDGKGKSGCLAQMVDFWIGNGIPTLSFSFEDVSRRMLLRMGGCRHWYSAISAETSYVRFNDKWEKMIEPEQEEYRKKINAYCGFLGDAPFWMYDNKMTVEEACSKIRHHHRTDKIQAVTIDGFKDIIPSKGDGQTESERHIAIELQKVAKDTGVAIITVSHIHKIEDGKPISRMNIMGSSVQFQGARQVLIFQDAGVSGVDGVSTFALDACKSNFARGGMVLLKRDENVLSYQELVR